MEKISKPEVKTQDTQDAYESYLTRVSDNLFTDPDHPERGPRSRSIVYVPYRGFSEQLQQDCPGITLTGLNGPEVAGAVSAADVIINIARGEEVVEAEIGHPDRNVKLPPESLANTEMVGDLYLQAIEKGNTDVQVVHTGRMNNKTIAMATALKLIQQCKTCRFVSGHFGEYVKHVTLIQILLARLNWLKHCWMSIIIIRALVLQH